ncbi:MAG: GerMN domain-containing protein [Fusobacteriaceae bacterium]
MKLKIITILSIILAIATGINYFSVKVDGQKVNEIVFDKTIPAKVEDEKVSLGLYVPNNNLTRLEMIEVNVKYTQNKSEVVKIVVENVSTLLVERGIISKNLGFINCFFSGKDLYINLEENAEFKGDSKKIIYILYSLSNSLVDLGGVERVKFLINNKEGTGVFEQYYNKNTDI